MLLLKTQSFLQALSSISLGGILKAILGYIFLAIDSVVYFFVSQGFKMYIALAQFKLFDDKVFDGLILGTRLGLDSNDFTVSIEDDYTTFTTYGHGHGLGLSKYGAEAMARAGYNYKQIISHYYPNTYIEKVNY